MGKFSASNDQRRSLLDQEEQLQPIVRRTGRFGDSVNYSGKRGQRASQAGSVHWPDRNSFSPSYPRQSKQNKESSSDFFRRRKTRRRGSWGKAAAYLIVAVILAGAVWLISSSLARGSWDFSPWSHFSFTSEGPSGTREDEDSGLAPLLFPFQPEFLVSHPIPETGDGLLIEHRVRRGETLSTIFSALGLARDDASAVASSLKVLANNSSHSAALRPGQLLQLKIGSSGQLTSMVSPLPKASKLEVIREQTQLKRMLPELPGSVDGFRAKVIQAPSSDRERLVTGEIRNSFAGDARAAGLPYAIIDDLVDILGDRISFNRDLRRGDKFVVIYEDRVLTDGSSLGEGRILAATLEVGSKKYTAIRYVGSDGTARYFDENGEVLGSAFLRYPLKFTRISSQFTKSRFHPVLKKRRPHNGVDFAAPTGTAVRTVGDGYVTFAGRKGGAGNMVKIRHSDRYTTAYLHLSKIGKGIRKGKKLQRGELIGAVGMTGWATGPHLHYSLYDKGRYVDPLKAELPKVENLKEGQRVGASYLARALFTLEHYQKSDLRDALDQ